MTFDELIDHEVNTELHTTYRQIPDADRTELAIALLTQPAIDPKYYDIGEFLSDKRALDDMFARAKAGDFAELGALFVRAMWDYAQPAIEDAMHYAVQCREERDPTPDEQWEVTSGESWRERDERLSRKPR